MSSESSSLSPAWRQRVGAERDELCLSRSTACFYKMVDTQKSSTAFQDLSLPSSTEHRSLDNRHSLPMSVLFLLRGHALTQPRGAVLGRILHRILVAAIIL